MNAAVVRAAFADAGYFDARSYSGRNMYGRTCLGIDLDRGVNPMQAVLEAVSAFAIGYADTPDEVAKFADLLSVVKTDSMGLGSIVYFPEVAWEES